MFNPISNYDLSAIEEAEKKQKQQAVQIDLDEDEFFEDIFEDDDLDDELEEDLQVDVAVVVNTSVVIFASELGYYSFGADHPCFEEATKLALECLDDNLISTSGWDYLGSIHSVEKALIKWSNGRLAIEGNRVRFDGDLLPASLETHLLNLYSTGKEYALEAWSKFAEKLREASHTDTHNRLHAFLQYNDLAINAEGNVLAWKVVRSDFKDKHSGTFDNSPGQTVSMPRTKVTFDPNQTCSAGLHACAYDYLKSFGSPGDQVVLVEIDVRDIVSVPTDYDGKKIRCCKYVVRNHVGTWGHNIDASTNPRDVLDKI